MIPGKGNGYIVGLKNPDDAADLRKQITDFAKSRDLPVPEVVAAWEKSRTRYCFFLLPFYTNPKNGKRAFLFSSKRSIEIGTRLTTAGASETRVYGQWIDDNGKVVEDFSALYMMVDEDSTNEDYLRRFIQEEIYGGGEKCDQAVIYLSVKGQGVLVCHEQGLF